MVDSNIRLAKEAFMAKDYISTCEIIHDVFSFWQDNEKHLIKRNLDYCLSLIEQLVELPEIEVTDFIVSLLAETRVILERTTPPPNYQPYLIRLKKLSYDFYVIVNYFNEYFGPLNQSKQPVITVGIENDGKYCFYENVYESVVNKGQQSSSKIN